MHAGEVDHARPEWTTSRRIDRTPVEESVRMTEDRDKWRNGVATLGPRTAKEQNRAQPIVGPSHRPTQPSDLTAKKNESIDI